MINILFLHARIGLKAAFQRFGIHLRKKFLARWNDATLTACGGGCGGGFVSAETFRKLQASKMRSILKHALGFACAEGYHPAKNCSSYMNIYVTLLTHKG